MTPFDFVNSINKGEPYLMTDELSEKEYVPFLTNRALSYFPDTVFYANEMNIRHGVDNQLAYDYYINIVRPRKRFSKWFKPEGHENIGVIVEYYKCSYKKASEYLKLLSPEQVEEIKIRIYKGD